MQSEKTLRLSAFAVPYLLIRWEIGAVLSLVSAACGNSHASSQTISNMHEPDLDWFYRPRNPSEPDPDWFAQTPLGKAPEILLDEGRILVLEPSWEWGSGIPLVTPSEKITAKKKLTVPEKKLSKVIRKATLVPN